MHVRPGMANQIYGHAKRDRQGALWLQYWFFYFYNNKAFLFVGLHEGDWEMIQLRIGAGDTPDVVYLRPAHKRGTLRMGGRREGGGCAGPAPVVYSARGSHASYFRRGIYTQAPIVPDHNDAGGPRVRPTMSPIEDGDPAWVAWPGRWGNTKALVGPIGADSPPGPSHHGAWRDPLTFHNNARPAAAPGAGRGSDRGIAGGAFDHREPAGHPCRRLVQLRAAATDRADGEGPARQLRRPPATDGRRRPSRSTPGPSRESSNSRSTWKRGRTRCVPARWARTASRDRRQNSSSRRPRRPYSVWAVAHATCEMTQKSLVRPLLGENQAASIQK